MCRWISQDRLGYAEVTKHPNSLTTARVSFLSIVQVRSGASACWKLFRAPAEGDRIPAPTFMTTPGVAMER